MFDIKDVFAKYEAKAWPITFSGALHISTIAGGTPSDPKVAEGWLKTKIVADRDDLLREAVATTMAERGITAAEAAQEVDKLKHLNGFKRLRCPRCQQAEYPCATGEHPLYIEGRQLKSALKEAVSVAMATGKIEIRGWGKTKKWITAFFAEHVFVVDERLTLLHQDGTPFTMPTGVVQRFVHTHRGTGIQYEEYAEDAFVEFTIKTDYDFPEKDWAMVWKTGGEEGIGASRSQGFGRYRVVKWEQTKR